MKKLFKNNKGFTMVELLVVISIIGLISSIIVTNLAIARTKAQYARANEELKQLINVIVIAQQGTNKTLTQITGRGWTDGSCFGGADLRGTTGQCYTDWVNSLTNIQQNQGSNNVSLLGFSRDPWGSPYALDENELENPNDCRFDDIHSAGADGILGNTDDINFNIPHVTCP